MDQNPQAHFEGKTALHHVVERRVSEMSAAAEEHGLEAPAYLATACDSMRETAVALSLLMAGLSAVALDASRLLCISIVFGVAYAFWKAGRGAHLGWARLERLHRIIEQERFEIQHHRPQEREELGALYAAKGFEGRLLEDVLDVLMADEDRLLRVMLLEELGLPLESYEHPLKQAIGAAFGALTSTALCCMTLAFFGSLAMLAGAAGALVIGASASALLRGNRLLPALIWNVGLGGLSFSVAVFLIDFLKKIL